MGCVMFVEDNSVMCMHCFNPTMLKQRFRSISILGDSNQYWCPNCGSLATKTFATKDTERSCMVWMIPVSSKHKTNEISFNVQGTETGRFSS